ncbi:MAG: hypothetical protein GY699_21890 [Desulfobacteraceae bacterium]|nr:hypothetical protein [Desulfobacteraceae bacterium]
MECSKCKVAILNGDEREHKRKILCEDCYIDVLSPAKFCDPWADYAAKSFVEKNSNIAFSDNQSIIIKVLKEYGEVEPIILIDKLKDQISAEDGERECAALHRMGKITIENNDGKIILKLK